MNIVFTTTFRVTGKGLQVVQVQPSAGEKFQARVLTLTVLASTLLVSATLAGKALALLTAGSPVLAGVVLTLVLPTLLLGNAISKAFVPQVKAAKQTQQTQPATTTKPLAQKVRR